MILGIRHVTHYRFDAPRRALTQSLRLRPAEFEGQRVLSWAVAADGADFGALFTDGAGDILQTLTLIGPVVEAEIEVMGTVETQDTQGVLRGHRERCQPAAYLRSTRLTTSSHEVRDFAGDTLRLVGTDDLDRAHALTRAVSDALAYSPGATHAATTAADALSEGHGVCQDQAHLLIAAALTQNIPARYVAGYILAPGAMGQASHAWAELHVAGLGWVGFDPTNRSCPDERHIRLGSGLDAVAAAPIRGLTEGIGEEELDVHVEVTRAQQQ